MRFAPLALIALLAACDVAAPLPAGISQADLAVYRAAMAANGCLVNSEETAAPVEAATGFDEDKLRVITDYLVETGEVTPTIAGVRLTTGSCADA